MHYDSPKMPFSGLVSERYLPSNSQFLAATSLATAVVVWVIIRRRFSSHSSSLSASAPPSWQSSPAGLLQNTIYTVVSTLADGPLRVFDLLNSTSHRFLPSFQRSSNTSSRGPPGLRNIDNSCYQNSTIQGFASLDSLRQFLAHVTTSLPDLAPESTAFTLYQFLEKLSDENNDGVQFWLPRVLKSMDSWEQQDAHEYFSKVLDDVEKEVIAAIKSQTEKEEAEEKEGAKEKVSTDPEKTDDSHRSSPPIDPPRLPLEGLTAQYVRCTTCGYSEGLSLTPFTSLTVPLECVGVTNIQSCLDEFTKMEAIDEVQCAKCTVTKALHGLKKERSKMAGSGGNKEPSLIGVFDDRITKLEECFKNNDFSDETLLGVCKIPKKTWMSSTKTRQAVLASLPPSLVIHINRSVFNELTGAMRKNTSLVGFPLELDLAEWSLSKASRQLDLAPDMHKQPYAREFIRDTAAERAEKGGGHISSCPDRSVVSLLPASAADAHISAWRYRLRALVAHHGRHENGHYFCYRYHDAPSRLNQSKPASQQSGSDSGSDSSTVRSSGSGANTPGLGSDADADAETGRWWYFSDEYVSESSEAAVLRQGEVFMLFYERVAVDPAAQETCLDDQAVTYRLSNPNRPTDRVPTGADGEDQSRSSSNIGTDVEDDDSTIGAGIGPESDTSSDLEVEKLEGAPHPVRPDHQFDHLSSVRADPLVSPV